MAKEKEQKRPGEMSEIVGFWLDEINASKERDKDFRKEGQRVIDIYSGKKHKTTPFNILYSNTETLLPALFSQVPRPVVQRRFKDSDPMGKASSEASQRALEFLLDTNVEGYETFEEGMSSATLDALLPGRGVTCVKYDATVSEVKEGEETTPVKTSELVCIDTKSWDRVYFGYAKKWSKVPWIAYEEYVDIDEAKRLFGEDISGKITFTDEEKDEDVSKDNDDKGKRKTAKIYQIWDREGGKDGKNKIRYISPHYKDGYLKVGDDSLGLTGFYNCPKPIQFLKKSNDLNPVALYLQYENQAEELNNLTNRINKIIKAIKARGVYDTELGDDIANIMKADDNELVPADKSSSLSAEKGLQNAIWFMPIEQLVKVLRELYGAREQCKQVIYEITGIADILRGSSKASETLGAQEIKERWGGLRLKRLQREVQRYARDMLRMMLEVAASKFSEDTWAKMTGLPFITTEEYQQLQQIAQAAQMSGQQLDPSTQQKLQSPVWGKVLELLKNDLHRAYRIDIETNSTVEPEAVEDQKNITDLMAALSQYLNGVGPLVSKGVLPLEAAQSMLLAITRRFRFGSDVEDYIKQMQPPKPEDDGKAGEQAKLQAEQQAKQAEMQMNMQARTAELQQQGQIEMGKHERELQSMQATQQLEMQKLQMEREFKASEIQANREAELAKLQSQRETEKMKMRMQQETELQKASMQAAAQIQIAKINAESQKENTESSSKTEKSDSNNENMQAMLQSNAEMLRILAAPKKVERDSQGRALRLVPQGS